MFDSGITHTLIAKTFVNRIGVSVEDLGDVLVVSAPVRALRTTGECVRGVAVVIQQRILLTDLTILPMWEFGVIFGLD